MEERERRVLERHREDLVSAIADVEPILDHLVSAGVFRANDDNVQNVRSERTSLMRARTLLDILPSKGAGAFRHFVHVLRSRTSHLAEMLELSSAEMADDTEASSDATDFQASPGGLPTPPQPTACKLQKALRNFHTQKARRLPLFDFQSGGESVGLDEVFVTLSTLDFRDLQSMFAEGKRLSAEKIRELASKTWCERREHAQEITDLERLLRLPNGQPADGTLLLAQAAGGKTLTLLKVASLWAEGTTDFLQQFEFVFYVRGRDEAALKGTSAIDVLQLDEFDLNDSEKAEMAKYLSENSDKVLVLLDGADEGGDLWMKSKGLEKIFERKGALRSCSFVVSSRPCGAAYRLISRCDQHFHLVGVNDQHLEELLVRRLGEVDGRTFAGELKQADWRQLRALMKETPLVANMVAALRKDGMSLPSTRTELYTVMVVNMVIRTTVKWSSGRPTAASTLNDLPAKERKRLLTIGQMALKGLKAQRCVFDVKKEVRPLCGDAAEQLGFVEEFRTMSIRGERHEVQFCHLSYQEYLAAYFVSCSADVTNELESCHQAIGFGEETVQFWRFVGGLLGREKVKVLTKFLNGVEAAKDGSNTGKPTHPFQMRCFAEAMEQPFTDDTHVRELSVSHVQEAAMAFLPDTVDLSSQVLSLSDVHAVAVSLAHSRHVSTLDVSSTNLNHDSAQALCAHGGIQHLRCLRAVKNPCLHGQGLAALAKSLGRYGQLVYINVCDCCLDVDDCASLKHILITNKNLQTLYLSGNTMPAEALRFLRQSLASSQLRILGLPRTSMDAEGARVIGETLLANHHLEELILDCNPLGNGGAAFVLEGVKKANALNLLSMDSTNLDDGVMSSLSEVVKERALTPSAECDHRLSSMSLTVSLHGNSISASALAHLAQDIPHGSLVKIMCGMHAIKNGNMHKRDLSEYFSKYTQRGGKGDLQMHSQGIDKEGVIQITAQLEHDSCSVVALLLGWNSIADDGAILLAKSLVSNTTLRSRSVP